VQNNLWPYTSCQRPLQNNQHTHTRTKTIKDNQTQSNTLKNNQKQSKTIKNNQKQSKTIKNTQTQSKTIKHNQKQSKTIRNNQKQSKTIKNNQKQSKTIKNNQEQRQATLMWYNQLHKQTTGACPCSRAGRSWTSTRFWSFADGLVATSWRTDWQISWLGDSWLAGFLSWLTGWQCVQSFVSHSWGRYCIKSWSWGTIRRQAILNFRSA